MKEGSDCMFSAITTRIISIISVCCSDGHTSWLPKSPLGPVGKWRLHRFHFLVPGMVIEWHWWVQEWLLAINLAKNPNICCPRRQHGWDFVHMRLWHALAASARQQCQLTLAHLPRLVMPPSTVMSCAVMKLASSEARNLVDPGTQEHPNVDITTNTYKKMVQTSNIQSQATLRKKNVEGSVKTQSQIQANHERKYSGTRKGRQKNWLPASPNTFTLMLKEEQNQICDLTRLPNSFHRILCCKLVIRRTRSLQVRLHQWSIDWASPMWLERKTRFQPVK